MCRALPDKISSGIPSGKAAQVASPIKLWRCLQNLQRSHLPLESYIEGSLFSIVVNLLQVCFGARKPEIGPWFGDLKIILIE